MTDRKETGQTPFPGYDPRPWLSPRADQMLMRRGTEARNTVDPETAAATFEHLLRIWELNREARRRGFRRDRPAAERLRGLFGGR